VGYLMIKAQLPRAPLILGLVLAPIMEQSLRQALTMSRGDPMIFIERPIALTLLIVVVLSIALPLMPNLFKRRRRAA
jgi:putative tricarboxylic transport membrane protein